MSFDLTLVRGSLAAFASGPDIRQHLGNVAYLTYVPDGRPHRVELRFGTEQETTAQIAIQDMNSRKAVVSEFVVSNAAIAPCQ